MAMRQDVSKQIEGQIAVWQAQIKEHQERMAQAGEAARANHEDVVWMRFGRRSHPPRPRSGSPDR